MPGPTPTPMGDGLRHAANAYLVAYAADAVLSLVELSVRAATGSAALTSVRNTVALAVAAASSAILAAAIVDPRLPLRVFATLPLFALWFALGGAPLPLLVPESGLGWLLVGFQLAMVAVAFGWVRYRTGGAWLLTAASVSGSGPSWIRSLRRVCVALLVGVPAFVAYGVVFAVMWLELTTHGFLSFDLVGVSVADRSYERAGHEVRLVGMMHVGQDDVYRRIAQSFVEEGTIVLEEGVSDEDHLLREPISYEGAAAALGLQAQRRVSTYLAEPNEPLPEWPVLRRADLDLRDFHPDTVRWLQNMPDMWRSGGPLRAAAEIGTTEEARRLLEQIEDDVIRLRNEHLLGQIDVALREEFPRIVVPWGALHLSAIEQALLAGGFEAVDRRQHRLVTWAGVAAAMR